MEKNTKILMLGIVIILLVLTLTSLTWSIHKDEVVKIGVIGPFSGNLARQGELMRNGIELALDDVDSENIQLIYEDTKCISKDTSNALNKLINVDDVVAYIGPFCGGSEFTAAEISSNEKILGVTPNLNYGRISDYFISTQSLLADEPAVMADYTYNELGIKRVAILYFNNDFGLVHKDTFKEEFEKLGGSITSIESISSFAQSDFRTELTKIKASNPEAIYIAYSSIANIVNQMTELDMNIQILGQYGIQMPALLNVAGENAEGIIYSYRSVEDTAKTSSQKEFESKYKARYGESAGLIASESYDAFMLLNKALEKCGPDSECLRVSILSTQNYNGASGSISFNQVTYAVDKPVVLKTVRNGKFVIIG